jgi:hypothetical protein
MKAKTSTRWFVTGTGVALLLLAASAYFLPSGGEAQASPPWCWLGKPNRLCQDDDPHLGADVGGEWHWMRSPDEEKRVVMGIYNRFCIRCHGVDGRGIWDIPGVPNFTNVRWQATRDDRQIARIIIEGRGAVMPPFRGVLTVEEAFAMARYLRTFVPGTEVSPPDFKTLEKVAPPKVEIKDKKDKKGP